MGSDTKNFQKDVIEQSKRIPVLVDFWAEWCGPCKILGPLIERIAEKYKGRFTLVKLNTEQYPEIAADYRISSIPNVKLFIDGKVADEFVGALPENMIEKWLLKALPDKKRDKIKKAKNYLSQKNVKKAQKILQDILNSDPSHEEAAVLFAKTLIYSNPTKAVELVKNFEPGSEFYPLAETIQRFGNLFHYQKNPDQLPPGNVQNDYRVAIENLHKQNFEKALDGFIRIMTVERYYDDDGPRKACIAIFKYLGEENETTREYRTKFSRALYI